MTKIKFLGHYFEMQDSLEERMKCANKARWKVVKTNRSKDVPWHINVQKSGGPGMQRK